MTKERASHIYFERIICSIFLGTLNRYYWKLCDRLLQSLPVYIGLIVFDCTGLQMFPPYEVQLKVFRHPDLINPYFETSLWLTKVILYQKLVIDIWIITNCQFYAWGHMLCCNRNCITTKFQAKKYKKNNFSIMKQGTQTKSRQRYLNKTFNILLAFSVQKLHEQYCQYIWKKWRKTIYKYLPLTKLILPLPYAARVSVKNMKKSSRHNQIQQAKLSEKVHTG